MLIRLVLRNNEMKITHLVAAVAAFMYLHGDLPHTGSWEYGHMIHSLVSRSPQAT